jgi:aminomuconate-semialdehyde/2-hydroxymuconate-6-semialdehyde dehydrogenase
MTTEILKKIKHLDHFINGEFRSSASGEVFKTMNPATGDVLATVSLGTAKEIDEAVKSAKHAFEHGPWPKMSLKERCAILKRIGDIILERKAEIALAETLDTGKPITESLEGDIPRSAMNFHFFADYAQTLETECFTGSPTEKHFAVREPLGVAGLITPWNLPLYLATWKIAPALVMGNTCVLKPAEWTPYTATLLGGIANDAGLPPGVLNIVHGFGANGAGEALTRHPDVSCISFTGETTTGKAIMASASSTLKKLSFELGGKGANIIFEDADLEEAIPTAVRAGFRNQGQICLAGSRLYVQEGIFDKVIEQLTKQVKAIRVGDPQDPQTQMGAIISKEQLEKVEKYVKLGEQEGKVLAGGERLKEFAQGNWLAPTLIAGIDNSSKLCQEEIFGPVLTVVPFASEEEVIAYTNSTTYGLSASLWSKDAARCERVAKQIKTGIVWVNCWFVRDLRTPFGGQKASGIGREGGRWSLEFFSEAKTITYKYKE